MGEYGTFPVLEIDLRGIKHNMRLVTAMCAKKGIEISGVVKGTDSYEHSYYDIATAMLEGGCKSIADSRLNTIKRMREMGIDAPVLLLRIPMLSEVDELVEHVDISLNSEPVVIEAINAAALRKKKIHKIILMMDLGDLREGFFDEQELIDVALHVENELHGLHLYGVGTNLGCFGSIKPDAVNLSRLVSIAQKVSEKIGRKLEIVSGGGTTTLPLVLEGKIPEGINHLRTGEAVVLARDLADLWECNLGDINNRCYVVKAQVIEVKEKPTYPIGEIFLDAFGYRPVYEDKGIRKRALVALGRRDIGGVGSLTPCVAGATVEGGSSDHLILDVTDCAQDVKVGDILEFNVYYEAMVHLTNSSSVTKVYLK